MKRLLITLAAVGSLAFTSGVMAQAAAGTGIVDSYHDFSDNLWFNSSGHSANAQICQVCHAPHNPQNWETGQLWNHEMVDETGTFTLYDKNDPANGTTTGTLDHTSILCMSCHDGSIAVDNFGGGPGAAGTVFIPSWAAKGEGSPGVFGGKLQNDHPLGSSADYDNVTIGAGEFNDISTTALGMNLSVDNQVGCGTCHDVHNGPGTQAQLLRGNLEESQLCLTCHNK